MEAPRIPRIFGVKTKKPNQFYFEPRYYDENREKRSKRNAQIARKVELEKKSQKSDVEREEFKSTLRENWADSSHRRKEGSAFNVRIIIYITVLFGLAYFILR